MESTREVLQENPLFFVCPGWVAGTVPSMGEAVLGQRDEEELQELYLKSGLSC